jgi:hypothetical protein
VNAENCSAAASVPASTLSMNPIQPPMPPSSGTGAAGYWTASAVIVCPVAANSDCNCWNDW